MNLRSMDLNLLLVFDAVYAERSVSRGAIRLNLSQPAASNALARLREAVGDPLFIREGNDMSPTPRAKMLRDPIRQALELIEQGFRNDESFDFSRSKREFVIALGDYGETVIIPRIIDWLTAVAPGIRIRIKSESSWRLKSDLRTGAVDLAVDYFALPDHGFHSECVLRDSLISLSRINHPLIGQKLSLETFLALNHVVIAPTGKMTAMIDRALAKRGLKRRIALIVPHFLSMPALVQSSDLICTLPRRMAYLYADHFRLKLHNTPLQTPDFPAYLIWHESLDDDPGHVWLREHLIAMCANM